MSEKLLEMRHFRVLLYPEEPELAPSRVAELARDEKNERSGSNGGDRMYNRRWPGSQNGNPGLYACLYCVALLIEVAYAFDSLGPKAMRVLPIVFLWIAGTTVGALLLLWRSEAKGRAKGILIPALLLIGSAILLFAALCAFLPSVPITQARIQTYSAQAAYLKWVAYGMPSVLLLLLLPFQCVVRLQAELKAGAHGYALAMLIGDERALPPRGVCLVRPWVLWTILLVALAYSLAARSHLLDNLLPGRFINLFILLVQIRWLLYLAFGVQCSAWYGRALNELKRECLVVQQLSR